MGQKSRILIVDDDAEIRTQLRWMLADQFEIATAGSMEEAAAKIDEGTPFSAAIVDLHLPPDLSTIEGGLTLIRSVRDAGAKTRIIVLSADGTEEARNRSLQAGATRFLDKPVNRSRVLRALEP